MITYRKVLKEEKSLVISLINEVLNDLERKDFFMPFTKEDIDNMFDDTKIIIYGAYDNNKLVGTAQLYLEESYVKDIKKIINLENCKIAELGRYLVLEEYRNRGIIKKLESLLIDEAKKLKYGYIVITVHPDNIPSNKATLSTGAKIITKTKLDGYIRNIYLLSI